MGVGVGPAWLSAPQPAPFPATRLPSYRPALQGGGRPACLPARQPVPLPASCLPSCRSPAPLEGGRGRRGGAGGGREGDPSSLYTGTVII